MARRGEPVDGVMLFDKPEGMSSNAAVQTVRRMLNARKAGHTGTLDPMATGLLPLCFGNATKFSADLLHADKGYAARVRLGITTDTGDAEGEPVEVKPVTVTMADIEAAASAFRGEIDQIPPMYSALKRNGRPLYALAREGVTVEREARRVTVKELTVSDFDGESFTMACLVTKGTYIRVLAEDIGRALGCGAHLTALRRTRVGELTLRGAETLESLRTAEAEGGTEAVRARLAGTDLLLSTLPAVELATPETERFLHGQKLSLGLTMRGLVRVYGPAENAQTGGAEPEAPARTAHRILLGTAEVSDRGVLEPKRLIAQSS